MSNDETQHMFTRIEIECHRPHRHQGDERIAGDMSKKGELCALSTLDCSALMPIVLNVLSRMAAAIRDMLSEKMALHKS